VRPLLIPLPGNEPMARGIAETGDFDVGALETRQFPDRETYMRHTAPLDGRSVALVCTLANPDPQVMPLLLAARSARELGASRIGLVAPYLAYMRQDRRFHDGEGISARYFAEFIAGLFDWLLTIDPHLHRIERLTDIYPIAAETLHAAPLLATWIRENVRDPVLIGPDAESRPWVAGVAEVVGAPFAVAAKQRLGDHEVRIELPDFPGQNDRTPVLVDDVASSGQTLMELARQLQEAGMPPPVCAVIHGLFAEDSLARLSETCARVVSTNTIPNPVSLIDVAPIHAEPIWRLAS
jgi:ribose-phosphate pyrophosphokinase